KNVPFLSALPSRQHSEPSVHDRLEAVAVDLLPTRWLAWIALHRRDWRECIERLKLVHAVPLDQELDERARNRFAFRADGFQRVRRRCALERHRKLSVCAAACNVVEAFPEIGVGGWTAKEIVTIHGEAFRKKPVGIGRENVNHLVHGRSLARVYALRSKDHLATLATPSGNQRYRQHSLGVCLDRDRAFEAGTPPLAHLGVRPLHLALESSRRGSTT